MFIRLPSDAIPREFVRRAHLTRIRAAILGTLLHAPMVLGVIALLEGRFGLAALGFAIHVLLGALPALALLPLFPRTVVAFFGRLFLKPRLAFALLECVSIVFGFPVGLLLWTTLWAG